MELSPSNDAVEQRAYEKWESEGRPEGREVEFWLKAEQELFAAGGPEAPGVPPIVSEGEPPD